MMFCQEERPKIKKEHPSWGVIDVGRECGVRWRALGEAGKAPYVARAKKLSGMTQQLRQRGESGAKARKGTRGLSGYQAFVKAHYDEEAKKMGASFKAVEVMKRLGKRWKESKPQQRGGGVMSGLMGWKSAPSTEQGAEGPQQGMEGQKRQATQRAEGQKRQSKQQNA